MRIGEEKRKEEKKKNPQLQNRMTASATQGGHNEQPIFYYTNPTFGCKMSIIFFASFTDSQPLSATVATGRHQTDSHSFVRWRHRRPTIPGQSLQME